MQQMNFSVVRPVIEHLDRGALPAPFEQSDPVAPGWSPPAGAQPGSYRAHEHAHRFLVRVHDARAVTWEMCRDEHQALASLESLSPSPWSENVRVVRRAIEAFSRGELQTALRNADPDAVVDWTRSPGLERGVYRGHEQARRFMATIHDLFERVQVEPEELLVRGDTVIAPIRTRVTGRYGIELETRNASLFRLRRGLIVLWRFFMDRNEALAAVGLQDR